MEASARQNTTNGYLTHNLPRFLIICSLFLVRMPRKSTRSTAAASPEKPRRSSRRGRKSPTPEPNSDEDTNNLETIAEHDSSTDHDVEATPKRKRTTNRSPTKLQPQEERDDKVPTKRGRKRGAAEKIDTVDSVDEGNQVEPNSTEVNGESGTVSEVNNTSNETDNFVQQEQVINSEPVLAKSASPLVEESNEPETDSTANNVDDGPGQVTIEIDQTESSDSMSSAKVNIPEPKTSNEQQENDGNNRQSSSERNQSPCIELIARSRSKSLDYEMTPPRDSAEPKGKSKSSGKHSDSVMEVDEDPTDARSNEQSKSIATKAPSPKKSSRKESRKLDREVERQNSTNNENEADGDSQKPQKRRRWLTKKVSEPQVLAISTDSLKNLIPDVKLVPLSDVKLDSSPERQSKTDGNEEFESQIKKRIGPVVAKEKERTRERRITDESMTSTNSVSVKKGLDDENSQTQLPPSPPKNNSSNILYITNLVRPFTVLQLKGLLARTGKIVEDGFWIDKIKSKCFVKFDTEE